ncbi:hypothetical protein [Aequorivita marina]|uniref:hypothetical protein n=1 Tax=Aequorivita marina TaxID=3073654 RepID=UPI002873F88B|nr:hypothetical protein [Aequorivita sp. S2608]MDS1299189.1 hypothetical protein [Aequorivita sp. S2608]
MKNIIHFIKTHPRNRLIIVKNDFVDVPYVDIGKSLSKRLRGELEEKSLPLITSKVFDEIVDLNLKYSEDLRNYIAIKNIGILMEKELKIDLKSILEKHSRGTTLIVNWDGEIEDRSLYFLSKEKGVEINLKDISHLTL